jgi:hypothetical protein
LYTGAIEEMESFAIKSVEGWCFIEVLCTCEAQSVLFEIEFFHHRTKAQHCGK